MDPNPTTESENPEIEEVLPEERAALATMAEALAAPAEMAAMNAQLRSAMQGAHALLHALVKQTAGVGVRVTIPRADWMAINPSEELEVITDKEGDIHLYIKRLNRQQRRADAKAK